MAKGIVYIVRNPAFAHLIKIGLTTKSCVEDRGLDASNVPEDYETLHAYECNNPKEVEDYLHELFKMYRHYSAKKGRETEFFYIGCLADAKASLEMLEKAGNRNVTEEFQEEIEESRNDNAVYDETKVLRFTRRSNFNFKEMNVPIGAVLNFVKNPNITVKVISDKTVEYQNEHGSFSRITAKLLGGNSNYVQPTKYWEYNGKNVYDIYNETYSVD